MLIKYIVISWMESWNRKETLGRQLGSLKIIWTLINDVSF